MQYNIINLLLLLFKLHTYSILTNKPIFKINEQTYSNLK